QFAIDFPEAWQSVFAPLHEGAGLLTPYDAAMEVLERWDVAARCPTSEGFLRRFLEVLFNAEEQGISDLSGFLDWWDANGSMEKAPLPESMDAVRIMTMHKAKGLEFDVVILPWLDLPLGRTSDDKAIFWNSRGVGLLAPLCKEMGRPWLRYRMDTARESLNLAYVAMTRAVSELYCFLPDADSGPVSTMLDSLIAPMRPQMKEEGETACWGETPHHLLPEMSRAKMLNLALLQIFPLYKNSKQLTPPLPCSCPRLTKKQLRIRRKHGGPWAGSRACACSAPLWMTGPSRRVAAVRSSITVSNVFRFPE
ncbi:MAG: hypothetical protein IJY48_01185, partial [Mailhella sp.]|nr:hypothetical protein [Mailhella sp.]